MTDATPKIGFWQFPIALKLVLVWLCLLCLINAIKFVVEIRESSVDRHLDITTLVFSITQFKLADGLIKRRNTARIWMSIFGVMSFMRWAILFGVAILYLPPEAIYGYELKPYVDFQMSLFQMTWFFILHLILDGIVLFILLRPSTKALFTPPSVTPVEIATQEAK